MKRCAPVFRLTLRGFGGLRGESSALVSMVGLNRGARGMRGASDTENQGLLLLLCRLVIRRGVHRRGSGAEEVEAFDPFGGEFGGD